MPVPDPRRLSLCPLKYNLKYRWFYQYFVYFIEGTLNKKELYLCVRIYSIKNQIKLLEIPNFIKTPQFFPILPDPGPKVKYPEKSLYKKESFYSSNAFPELLLEGSTHAA